MAKTRIAAAALGLAALGSILTGTSAQAAATAEAGVQAAGCADWYNSHAGDGNMWAWDYTYCDTRLGYSQGNDSNWSDGSGPFQGGDNDDATSIMNTGVADTYDTVKFYRHSGYGGGHGCLTRGEKYADSLGDNTFSDGSSANNNISSHKWVSSGSCSRFLT
ncbi:hypothetical protein [Streptomyces sp. NPDC003023]|uniref:hypothetical protein n=1 Tax=Streptomyces sp. NPDC003023 TaxID=3364675 RepID=UPI0036B6B42D